MLEHIIGNILVLDLFHEMPEHERGNAAFTIAEKIITILDQHLANGERHGFEAFGIGDAEGKAACAGKAPVFIGKPGFESFDGAIAARNQLIIEAAMLTEMHRLLRDIIIKRLAQFLVAYTGTRRLHGLYEVRLKMGHGERGGIHDL
jgi:hypothetical protein